jgi:hypothetical protein
MFIIFWTSFDSRVCSREAATSRQANSILRKNLRQRVRKVAIEGGYAVSVLMFYLRHPDGHSAMELLVHHIVPLPPLVVSITKGLGQPVAVRSKAHETEPPTER